MRWSVQAPRGTLRRLQPEPHPLGRLVLRCQHTLPKSRSFFRCSFSGPHHDPLLTLPYPPPTTPTSLTALSLNRRPLVGHIWVSGPQSPAANPPPSWQVARGSAWAFLATQKIGSHHTSTGAVLGYLTRAVQYARHTTLTLLLARCLLQLSAQPQTGSRCTQPDKGLDVVPKCTDNVQLEQDNSAAASLPRAQRGNLIGHVALGA